MLFKLKNHTSHIHKFNVDFEYMGECPLPRLGNGSFTFAVRAMYQELTGRHTQEDYFRS